MYSLNGRTPVSKTDNTGSIPVASATFTSAVEYVFIAVIQTAQNSHIQSFAWYNF